MSKLSGDRFRSPNSRKGRKDFAIFRTQKAAYILIGVRGDYYVRMKFCSDKNAPRGVLKASVGVANSFFMVNDAVKTGICRKISRKISLALRDL